MYGDSDWDKRESRPLSFAPSAHEQSLERQAARLPSATTNPTNESPLAKSLSAERHATNRKASPPPQRRREPSIGSSNGQASPPTLTRSPSTDTANQAFPLNDIDYESSPAAVAQELSNLQAIRRMSMNIDAADPDLPGFSSGFGVPSVAPSPTADENDTSRLFWVPARLHPELAPKEFKTFVEDRVDRIKRRSRDDDGSLSPTSAVDRHSSSSSMNRRRSMLSKTIEMPQDFNDGADILERKRSGHQRQTSAETSLQELELLVTDPATLVRKMSLDTARRSLDSDGDAAASEDMPMIPNPTGQTLKRSTRTQYRRGSVRKEGRMRRVAGRTADGAEPPDSPSTPNIPPVPDLPTIRDVPEPGVSRVRTDPVSPSQSDLGENFSRPLPRSSHQQPSSYPSAGLEDAQMQDNLREPTDSERDQVHPKAFQSRIARNGRTTAPVPGYPQHGGSVPQIVETPPPADARQSMPVAPQAQSLPDRTASYEFTRTNSLPAKSSSRSSNRPAFGVKSKPNTQSLEQMEKTPSAMPGTNTSTDALSFIPTFPEGKKSEKKQRGSKEAGESTSKKSWGWLGLGSEDKEKRREEKEEKESSKKSKARLGKSSDKSYDNTRLDVLQTATDGPRGRESLVLDRDSLKLEEERKKESSRKSGTGELKKDKEPGIFSSLFGGKKKADRESATKKPLAIIRGLSPEPPRKILRADIDYNWTRFSILEERAIYRMAHIKLANPRRALYSQVLLSNFMYSYLAKVQQMHPQIQIPQFAQQKNGKQRAQEQKQDQPEEYSQWQMYQEQQERIGTDGSSGSNSSADFVDDYDPEHQQAEDARHAEAYGNGDGTYEDDHHHHQQQQRQQWDNQDPYAQQGLFDDDRPPEDNDMW